MSSAIILPIFYDRRSRRSNRRELFVKRFTSGCVVIATLFIVVGLSSATWYMTILGTFILMVVGLSGFFKYCDRTPDSRAVRRAISISSRISTTTRPSVRRSRSVATVGESSNGPTDIDPPPAYDNIVFDEPYSLGRASYHIRSYDHPSYPPPPYEVIMNAAVNQSAGHYQVPDDSTITHQTSSTLIMPRLSLNHGDRQEVDLSHAITITESSESHFTSRTVTPETPRTAAQEASYTVAPVLPLPPRIAPATPQRVTPEAPQAFISETCQTIATEAPQTLVSEIPQTDAEETSPTEAPQRNAEYSDSSINKGASNSHARPAPNLRGNDRMPEQSVSTAL
ncbi:uncharacterized protein LOC117105034 [Anneissia japonica]|uniref:uncharacterized protein LOC117105034 n=1 Tax=Anneissia japonica TaxID=1529436 RepID=UPI001425AEE2|nr:uncharacterized protein LOC117105034 [Anneissia japonica]